MNEQTLQGIRERMEQIRLERDRIAAELELKDRQMAEYQSVLDDMQEAIERKLRDERESLPAKFVPNQIVAIFKEEGRPLPIDEIYRRLTLRGVPVNGQNPVKNVGSHLSLDDRFERYGHGVWGLTSWKGRPPKQEKGGSQDDSLPALSRVFTTPAETIQRDEDELRLLNYLAGREARGA